MLRTVFRSHVHAFTHACLFASVPDLTARTAFRMTQHVQAELRMHCRKNEVETGTAGSAGYGHLNLNHVMCAPRCLGETLFSVDYFPHPKEACWWFGGASSGLV